MKKKISWPILFVLMAALAVLSFSRGVSDKIRGFSSSILYPIWELALSVRSSVSDTKNSDLDLRLEQLVLENQLLKNEISHLRAAIGGEELKDLLSFDFQIIPARIIFRSPGTWDNTLWINVGELTNKQLGKQVVQKNSPVIVKKSVVGMVDYVGNRQSRVRLITNSDLSLSVRVHRKIGQEVRLLAKGELQGRAEQVGNREYILRGVGFNYDYGDKEGPARDLRTGIPEGKGGPAVPILKKGDLLVTSGLDGVFPAGLHVASIQKIFSLKEGDYYFELEARPTVENLDHLSTVFVLQPLGYSFDEKN